MPVTNKTYADLVERCEHLERACIRAQSQFERIYRNSTNPSHVEGECSNAIQSLMSVIVPEN